jgi:hypothetical protein
MNGKARSESPEQIKKRIIELFNENVRGRISDTSGSNADHDGKDGHWLEKQMGIKHNGNNAPDLDGFEMKNNTTSKTTFGDWSPSRRFRIYKKGNEYEINRSMFLKIFGAPNALKEGRHSWSGKPVPKVGKYNFFGQMLKVDKEGNIHALYSYDKDQRENKNNIVPESLQQNDLILAVWDAEMMKKRVEDKFNKLGWFKCEKDKNGVYSKIVFGNPINFETWIDGVRKGLIFFDSGMYDGNPRPYANWRATNQYWESLIVDSY